MSKPKGSASDKPSPKSKAKANDKPSQSGKEPKKAKGSKQPKVDELPSPVAAPDEMDLDAALALDAADATDDSNNFGECECGQYIGNQPPLYKVLFQKAPPEEEQEDEGKMSEFIQSIDGVMAEQVRWIPSGAYRLSAVLHAAQNVPADADTEKFPLVIMSHGFTGNKMESGRLFTTTARAIAKRGMSVLRFDFMGSGDSTGEFYEMSPNTEIADLHAVIAWAQENGFGPIGLLGLSFGGAVSICTAAQVEKANPGTIAALATWSSVPGFKFWRPVPDDNAALPKAHTNGLEVGPGFYTDRPEMDVPESYQTLTIPKLQIQGDQDIEGFREKFTEFFKTAPKPKKHTVLRGANHVFTTWSHRVKVIDQTADWLAEQLLD